MYTSDVDASTPETHVQLMLKETKYEINVLKSGNWETKRLAENII